MTATATEAVSETVEAVTDAAQENPLVFFSLLVGGALATAWLVRRYGENAMDRAAALGTLGVPAHYYAAPDQVQDQDDEPVDTWTADESGDDGGFVR